MTELHPFLARLADAGEWEPPTTATQPRNGTGRAITPPSPGDPQAARYAAMALGKEADIVASTPEGGRNHALNKASFRMGQLVSRGWLSDQTAYETLVDAGVASGLSYAESERTVHSGLDAGQRAPRDDVELHKPTPAAYVLNGLPLGGADATTSSNEMGSSSEGPASPTEETAAADTTDAGHNRPRQLVDGGAYIYGALPRIPSVWGEGDDVLWAAGEPLLLTGPTGVGKTTLGTMIVAGRLGLLPDVLGYPVTPGRRTLVLAMDRPAQIQRAMARLLRQYPQDVLSERLVVWQGPPPVDLGRNPLMLYQLAQLADADTVVLDSLKDAAVKLSDEETGQGLARAMNYCVANGVQVLGYHHQKKHSSSGQGKPNTLADVYGSSWITAGVGSVLLLWGSAGDLVVELSHLKQPANEVGPLAIGHDHTAGRSFLYDEKGGKEGLLDLLESGPQSAATVASWLTDGAVDRAAVAKARRRLDSLVAEGLVVLVDPPATGGRDLGGHFRGREAGRYALADRRTHRSTHRSTPKTQLILETELSPGRTEEHPSALVDLDHRRHTTEAHRRHTTTDPQVTPKTHRSTQAATATEGTPPPPFRGGGVRARAHAYTRGVSHPVGGDVEVCGRCHQEADQLAPVPSGQRWCPRCVHATNRHTDHQE